MITITQRTLHGRRAFIGFFSDQTGCPLAGGGARVKLHFKSLELVLFWATLHFIGWGDPTPGFVGFRCTQPNLHFAGFIAKCETQQRPISEPSHESFFFDQTGRFLGRRRRIYETSFN
mgnify:CR=1 FL=1